MSLFAVTRSPRNIVFGVGQRHVLPRYAASLGKKALLVTDARLAGLPEFAELVDGLRSAGIETSVFDRTIAELPLDNLADGVDVGRKVGADLVIGIGGGSCMDAAKVIALQLAHDGKPSDYYGEFQVPGPIVPLICLPTTSGTGSEVTPVAVVGDPDRVLKVGIASPHLIPHTAICDPELTYSCPPGLTAISGADALTHAIEAFTIARRPYEPDLVHNHVFLGKNAASDVHALAAIHNVYRGLERAYRHGDDEIARQQLMFGALSAGLAFGSAGTAAAHAVQYPVGALTHSAHGAGVALMLPYVMAFNASHCLSEMAKIAEIMGVGDTKAEDADNAASAICAVADLFHAINIPATLPEIGIAADQLETVAEQALGITRLIKNNPRPLDGTSMRLLLDAAFTGERTTLFNKAELAEVA